MIRSRCPKCKSPIQYDDSDAGQKVKCPSCGAGLRAPSHTKPSAKEELLPVQYVSQPAAPQSAPSRMPPAPVQIPALVRCVCMRCQTVMDADARYAGTRATCPTCQAPIDIPSPVPIPPPVIVNVVSTAPAHTQPQLFFAPQSPPIPQPPQRSSGSKWWVWTLLVIFIVVGGIGLEIQRERLQQREAMILHWAKVKGEVQALQTACKHDAFMFDSAYNLHNKADVETAWQNLMIHVTNVQGTVKAMLESDPQTNDHEEYRRIAQNVGRLFDERKRKYIESTLW